MEKDAIAEIRTLWGTDSKAQRGIEYLQSKDAKDTLFVRFVHDVEENLASSWKSRLGLQIIMQN